MIQGPIGHESDGIRGKTWHGDEFHGGFELGWWRLRSRE
jgi:hypothetical protein